MTGARLTLDDFDGKLIDGLEFSRMAYTLFGQLKTELGAEYIRTRRGDTKKLLEELLLISRWVQTYYRLGRYISICWIDDNQPFDAEIRQHGEYIDRGHFPALAHLEVTCAMHENEYLLRQIMNTEGVAYAPEGVTKRKGKPPKSEAVAFSGQEQVLRFVPYVVDRIKAKSQKAYPPHTSLIIGCDLNGLYMPDDWRLLVSEVERQIDNRAPFADVLLVNSLTDMAAPLALYRDAEPKSAGGGVTE